MNALAMFDSLPDWINHKVVAGNSWGKLLSSSYRSSFWVLARILKAWITRFSTSSKEGTSRRVFLISFGKSLPLIGIWAGIKVGILYQSRRGWRVSRNNSFYWTRSSPRCCCRSACILFGGSTKYGLPVKQRKLRVSLMICLFQ